MEFECVSAQLYLVDDSQLQWRENISEKWTKKTSRIVKKCSIHECIFWFVPNPQGKDFDKSNQTSAWILPHFDQEIKCTERILVFSVNEKTTLKSGIIKNNSRIILVLAWWLILTKSLLNHENRSLPNLPIIFRWCFAEVTEERKLCKDHQENKNYGTVVRTFDDTF